MNHRLQRTFLTLASAAILLASAPPRWARAQAGPTAPSTRPAGGKVVDLKGIKLDVKARTVTLDTQVCQPDGPLEFLLVRAGGKEYESLLRTQVTGKQLHAALLALGLTQGKPARWVGQGPWARYAPPQGPGVRITLEWKDKKGKTHKAAAGRWLGSADQDKKNFNRPDDWIFIGSEIMPDGKYWADIEGELISVSNFASAVLDVPFESSSKNAMRSYAADDSVVPEAGTVVKMILQPLPGAEKSPDARVLLEIDRFGRLRIGGQPIQPAQLEKWAQEFVMKHPRAQVQIRADGRALVFDVARAREEVRLAGVDDIEVTRLMPEGVVLPRTASQAKTDLAQWKDKFLNAKDQIRDPGKEAQAVLEQIHADLEHLKATQAALAEHARRLREALEEYKKTQPADDAERF